MKTLLDRAEDFLELLPVARPAIRRLQRTLQFAILVWRGVIANRCPVRAAALSYMTLLALVPLLTVVFSVSKNFMHDTSATLIPYLMDKGVAMVAPQLDVMPLPEDFVGPPAPGQAVVSALARRATVEQIQSFIDNINAGTLGTLGTVLLIFVAVRLLMAIEETFNDIWGVPRGRSIWRKVVYYWTTLTLGPLLLVFAVYLTGRAEVLTLMGRVTVLPGFHKLLLQLGPFVILWIGFSLLYKLMPNTYVRPTAALAGGICAGTLWQINTWLSTMYVSRVISYSKIYGAIGIIPVLLVGLYFSWLIVLLGAQVAHAAQHIRTYLLQKVSERIDQRGRELIACRVVLVACEHFVRGVKPPTVDDLVERIGVPANWLNQLVYRLAEGGLVARIDGAKNAVVPARSPEAITIADVLEVMRSNEGSELGTGGDQRIKGLLVDLDAAQRSSSSNSRFSDLIDCSAN